MDQSSRVARVVALEIGGQGQLLNASSELNMMLHGESLVAFVELSSSHWAKKMNWEATL